MPPPPHPHPHPRPTASIHDARLLQIINGYQGVVQLRGVSSDCYQCRKPVMCTLLPGAVSSPESCWALVMRAGSYFLADARHELDVEVVEERSGQVRAIPHPLASIFAPSSALLCSPLLCSPLLKTATMWQLHQRAHPSLCVTTPV